MIDGGTPRPLASSDAASATTNWVARAPWTDLGPRQGRFVGLRFVKVVLAGGTGVLGRRIANDLRSKGHEIVVLARTRPTGTIDRHVVWDGKTVGVGS